MPDEIPVNKPVAASIVATEVLELDHVPPEGVERDNVAPVHTVIEPAIATGIGLTVTITEVAATPQPVDTE